MLNQKGAINQLKTVLWPALKKERERIARIDRWYRWDHDKPHTPRGTPTREYKEISARAQAPWGRRVVTAVTDQLYVEGHNTPDGVKTAAWAWWQMNGLDARQIAIHDAAVAYGLAYAVVLPGVSPLLGDAMPVIRGLDPSQMITVSVDPAWDEFPEFALRAESAKVNGEKGWDFRLYDDQTVHYLQADSAVDRVTWVTSEDHGMGVCPVVRFANNQDLRSRADGEVEPFIPLLGRIDQTTFDRLVVQRFSSFVVRYITGMATPDKLQDETEEQWRTRVAQVLKVSDILLVENPDGKIGSLPATPLDGFINAHEADVRALAAVSQTPVHELIGNMANLSADALAAAEGSLTRKIERRKHTLGESWEQALRLAGLAVGQRDIAGDFDSQVHWRDMESRSLAQAADALGKMAKLLGVPVEMLWEKIPGWTQQDVERAIALAEKGGALEQFMAELQTQLDQPAPV